MDGLEHQDMLGRYASFQGPRVHGLLRQQEWIARFGTVDKPLGHWKYAILDGCMLHVTCPDEELGGLPMKKPYCIMANFAVDALELRCKEGMIRLLPDGADEEVWKLIPEIREFSNEQAIVAQVAPAASAEFKDGPAMPVSIPGSSANVDTDALKLGEEQRQ